MSQSKPGAETAGLPGLSKINDIVSTYFSIWERNVQVLNEIFVDCTRPEVTVSDLPKAWSKLLHTWTHNAQDLCDAFVSIGGIFRDGGSPLVTFVVDRTCETAHSQTIQVPPGVDPTKLVAMPLVSLTEDGHPALDDSLMLLLPAKGSIEIRLVIPKRRPAPGRYLSVVCEPKAGDPRGHPLTNSTDPPPRTVIATVLVVFL